MFDGEEIQVMINDTVHLCLSAFICRHKGTAGYFTNHEAFILIWLSLQLVYINIE
jgi:hypothetical protein